MVLFGTVLAVVGLFNCIEQSLKENEENKKTMQNVETNFQTKMEESPSILNNQTQQKMIDKFMRTSYKMNIKIRGLF